MKKLLILALLSPLVFAGNTMRNMEEFHFQTIMESKSFKFEEIRLHDEAHDYVITLHSRDDKAQFEWTCALYPFLYVPELELLTDTGRYDLDITFDNGEIEIDHYTIHPNGAMISKKYISNHFPMFLEAVVNTKIMDIELLNTTAQPHYKFDNNDVLQALELFVEKCRYLEY